MLTEIQLLQWYHVLVKLLRDVNTKEVKQGYMRMLFYQSCRLIKRYFDPLMLNPMTACIDTYLLNF